MLITVHHRLDSVELSTIKCPLDIFQVIPEIKYFYRSDDPTNSVKALK